MVNAAASAGHYEKQLPSFLAFWLANCNSIPFTSLSLCEGFSIFLFLPARRVSWKKPFYGKLCCILSGNDAHPAASHPGHKMATPFVFLSPKNICIFISKTKHQLPAGKDKRQTTNGIKNKMNI